MGQLALTVVGAVIGNMIVPGIGGVIGGALGSAAGAALFPTGPDGPRLDDLSVQSSAYGQALPRLWGTARIAGNVIWSTELQEHEHEVGKGGGPVFYTYSASFAVSLCVGPIEGVSRIWADKELIYDIRPSNTGPQSKFTASSFVVYPGDEVQDVDPTMQAIEGDVPAYRGQAYVVFTDLDLQQFGNRLPLLEFEVVGQGERTLPPSTTFGEQYTTDRFEADIASDGSLWVATMDGHAPAFDFGVAGVPQVQRYDARTGELLYHVNIDLETTDNPIEAAYGIAGAAVCYGTRFFVGRGAPGTSMYFKDTCDAGDTCANPNPYRHGMSFGPGGSVISYVDSASSGQFQNAFYSPTVPIIPEDSNNPDATVYFLGGAGVTGGFGVGFLQSGAQDRPDGTCSCMLKPTGEFDGKSYSAPGWAGRAVKAGTNTWVQGEGFLSKGGTTYTYEGTPLGNATAWDEARGALWLFAGDTRDELYNFGTAQGYTFDGAVRGAVVDSATGNLRLLVGGGLLSTPELVLFNPDTHTIVESIELPFTLATGSGQLFDQPELGRVLYIDGVAIRAIPYRDTLEARPVLLADVVTDLSLAAGLTAGEIDVSELTDEVLGFALARQGATRSALEVLMLAYLFDAVESEGRIKFVKRGKPPVATLTLDDLAAHPRDGERPTPMPLSRADEAELPRQLSIRYTNVEADYQVGLQSAQRHGGRARVETTLDVPVVLTDTHARALADVGLYSAWIARTSCQWSTALTFAHLEPTDVVSIDGNKVRIERRALDAGVLRFEGLFDAGRILTAGAVAGAAGRVTETTIELVPQTNLTLLDLPLLADADEGAGFYVAAAPIDTADAGRWPGALVLRSADGGGSYTPLASLTRAATVGATRDALAAFDVNTFDEFNTVTVQLTSGTLAGATELAVLNGANLALVGDELVQFKAASLNVDGSYTLSGLLRGRRGTRTDTHVGGERFVLLDAAVRRVTGELGELGLTRLYKAVTVGASLESASVIAWANSGRGLLPLAGVGLAGGRDTSGNLTMLWTRRTRLDAQWRDGVDAGLGEASPAWSLDIYSGASFSTVLRTITTSDTSASYSVAEQVADFGTPQASVYVRLYQLSATVGRGAPLQGIV